MELNIEYIPAKPVQPVYKVNFHCFPLLNMTSTPDYQRAKVLEGPTAKPYQFL